MNFSKIWDAFRTLLVISLIFPALAAATPNVEAPLASAENFPEWGNDRIPDCVFASVADWEIAALHYAPVPTTVERAYWQAGGTGEGIDIERAFRWFRHYGIEGLRLRFREAWEPSMRRLKRWVRHYRYLIAGESWHEFLILGPVRGGIELVTYGERRTESWREAHERIFEIAAPSIQASS